MRLGILTEQPFLLVTVWIVKRAVEANGIDKQISIRSH
jgi:hypothetical protein